MLDLGSSGLMTAAWTAVMKQRFSGYALGLDGKPIKNDRYFGYDEQAVQVQYQIRTGQAGKPGVKPGRVSDQDLHRLGLLPTLITTHGAGQPDPFGIGYPADIARRLLHLFWWQPTGNYPASFVPMDDSVEAGEREHDRFIGDPNIVPGPVAFCDYSQGSIVGGRTRNKIRAGKVRPQVKLLGGATLGNPMRPDGAGGLPGSGLDPTAETANEAGMYHAAAPGDIYTHWEDESSKEMARAIFLMVFKEFTGRDSILEQAGELLSGNPFEIIAAGRAILRGGMFVFKGTGPHVRYHVNQAPGTGQTYYEAAVTHLDRLATTRLERIVADAR